MKILVLTLLCFTTLPFIHAQDTDTLNANNIQAVFNASGDLLYDVNTSGTPVIAPGNQISFSAANLWIGGYDQNGKLHVSAQTYRQTGDDFWPGPLDTIASFCPQSQSTLYNYVWKVSCAEVDSFLANSQSPFPLPGYVIPQDFITWPGNGNPAQAQTKYIAPFADVDGDQVYDYNIGDHPLIQGTQALFLVYNDSLQGVPHSNTTGARLGLQIGMMPYSFNYSWDDALMNTIFIRYKIFNSTTQSYSSTRLGFWYDIDTQTSDHEASDSINRISIHYNDDAAVGVYFLTDSMAGSVHYQNNFNVNGNPISSLDHYQLLNQQWTTNTHVTYGGNGFNTGNPTNWMYTGNPFTQTGWLDQSNLTDHRTINSTDTFTLHAGEIKEFVVAISFAYDTTATNASYNTLLQYMNDVRQFYATNTGYCLQPLTTVQEVANPTISAFPNPTGTTLNVTGTEANDRYDVIDVNGNIVLTGTSAGSTLELNISALTDGVYFLRVTSSKETTTTRIVKLE